MTKRHDPDNMSGAERLAMCERALEDIKRVKSLIGDAEWTDMLSATWIIASDALDGRYHGWVPRPTEEDEDENA